MTLGTYQTSEDTSPDFIPISGSGQPNVANTYLAWGQGLPTTFMNSAYSQGATPFIEFEPWHQGPSWNAIPSFSAIASNGDASDTNCSLDESTYATSCATWLADVGQAIASYGHPVVLTFAHEFNVSGQYPWAQGDTGSCGSSPCTPSEWIAAWDEVQSIIDANAGGNAFWMWAPNADTGGTTTDPTPWWPGSSHVDLVGVDGYPDTQYGSQFGTFSGEFGQTFSEVRNLGYTGGIFISETDLAPLDGSGYQTIPQFISALCADGGTGFLEYEDGTAVMTSTQWGEANTALSSDCPSSSTSPTQGAPAVVTSSASGVTSTTATLNGTVNPEGADASWQFDDGTSTAYGNVAPSPAGDAGSGTSPVSESTTITGLTPSTTYHYRIQATNSGGTSYGSDVTFTTAPSASSGPVTLAYNGLCLDDRYASTTNYNPIQVYTCNGTNAQDWTLTSSNQLMVLGKCLDVEYGGTADGTTVDLYDCNGTGAQVWVHQSDGAYLNPNSGKCLDDTNWGGSGTQAQIWDCTGGSNQSWSLP